MSLLVGLCPKIIPNTSSLNTLESFDFIYQVQALWDHSFSSYAADKQTNRQTVSNVLPTPTDTRGRYYSCVRGPDWCWWFQTLRRRRRVLYSWRSLSVNVWNSSVTSPLSHRLTSTGCSTRPYVFIIIIIIIIIKMRRLKFWHYARTLQGNFT